MSYSSAPVALLERASVLESERDEFTADLLESPAIGEVMVVSTCNRVEVYAAVEAFHPAVDQITARLARQAGLPVEEIASALYVRYATAAAEHMFNVASGLDSLVVGEQQIIGQIRTAYQAAAAAGSAGRTLHRLSQRALHVGKRVHTETGIDAAGASMVTVALGRAAATIAAAGPRDDLDGDRLAAVERAETPVPLAGKRAAVIGAGAMGGLAVAHLGRAGIAHIDVLNRTPERAERLAEIAREASGAASAQARDMRELGAVLEQSDVVFVCTGASHVVVSLADVHRGISHREPGRPLVICDLGMPRDVDPAVAGLPEVSVIDIEQLASDPGASAAAKDQAKAREIVAGEVHAYSTGERMAEVGPLIGKLRERGTQVVSAELRRFDSRNPALDPAARAEVESTVRRVVDKLLHPPTVRFKELAAGPDGDTFADIMRALFDLDETARKGAGDE